MTIQSHLYRDTDLPHLQSTLVRWIQWAGDCGYYHPGNVAHRLYEGFGEGQSPYELVRIWRNGDEIVGFGYAAVFDVAFFAFVAPDYRGTDLERTILRTVQTMTSEHRQARRLPVEPLITDVYNCDQIRMDLLAEQGFARYRIWDDITEQALDRDLPMPVVPEGFTIRSATMADAAQLAAIRNNCFGGAWTAEVYTTQVMGRPSYRPENELVVEAPNGELAAFTVIRLDALNRVGLFEPVGTHSGYRRLGLARGLMLHALRTMQAQGMTTAVVEHTAENEPAKALYHSLGFRKKYETIGFQANAKMGRG